MKALWLMVLLVWSGCASSEEPEGAQRAVREFSVMLDRDSVVPSSVLGFQVLNSADRQATGAEVRFAGVLEGGQKLDESYFVPVVRVADGGDLLVRVRVFDGLFEAVEPSPTRRFTGSIELRLRDAVGEFGIAYLEDTRLTFVRDVTPDVNEIESASSVFVNQRLAVEGQRFLMPDEGQTWAVIEAGQMTHTDGAVRQITNARIPLSWAGSRERAQLAVDPRVFGVRVGRFRGDIRFENELSTGEVFQAPGSHTVDLTLQKSRIDTLDPPAGSRGQRIRMLGRGFVPEDLSRGLGMYLKFEGVFTPANPELEPRLYEGASAVFRVPYRVNNEQEIDQNVWTDVTPNGQLSGLGATPGVFEGSVTPVVFDVSGEEQGEPWAGQFEVLPTKQVVYVRYLPGFGQALRSYGLQNVEDDVRKRVLYVLSRDYAGLNVEFTDRVPNDWVEYTTIEIGGPDPSGLLNFGYDNSFNDGGKDVGNRYLSDYLGGVNVHSQDAGYLPYGGVFIESFAAFSPTLFPQSFGTSESFDRIMKSVMPALGGTVVSAEEWPDGPRSTAIEAAINLVGTLAGHTASHEIGHSLGLAHFPETVDGFAERFHNDPPGLNWLMDAGSDRPFEERGEIDGQGPARFNPNNRAYLERILPLP